MNERAAPMYCPSCGEDPDRGHGDWRCEDCLRVFVLRYKGTTGTG